LGFDFGEAVETADKLLGYVELMKAKAAEYGLIADFRAKPFQSMNGSGMHMHLSLWKNGRNLFAKR
jgi:glutamine synthetase